MDKFQPLHNEVIAEIPRREIVSLTNSSFQEAVNTFSNGNLSLTVKNNFPYLGACVFRGATLCPVPRDLYVKHDIWSSQKDDIFVVGLKTVAVSLFVWGKRHLGSDWYQRHEKLMADFGLSSEEKQEVYKNVLQMVKL